MKKVPLTPEEKRLQQERLKAIPDDQKRSDILFVSRWVTQEFKKREFSLQQGPFSYSEMNGNAIDVIVSECYTALWEGNWRWPEDRQLSTQLIYIARSKMGHIIRDYAKHCLAKDVFFDDMTFDQLMKMEMAADQWEYEISMRELGYEMAATAVADNALFLRYLEVMYDVNAYDCIADKLQMSVAEVLQLEEKLLEYLAKKLRKKPVKKARKRAVKY